MIAAFVTDSLWSSRMDKQNYTAGNSVNMVGPKSIEDVLILISDFEPLLSLFSVFMVTDWIISLNIMLYLIFDCGRL